MGSYSSRVNPAIVSRQEPQAFIPIYENPFSRGGPPPADQSQVDEYSHPINVQSSPPTDTLLDEALSSLGAAHDAFRREDFARALQLTDEALRRMPDDPMLHQFRALSLFALRRYEEAAATLHAVLAVGPGWDWTTMVSLYGNRDTYTRQLRLLEDYAEEDPRAPAARFVLAYHYLTTGYADEATGQWARVLALRPNDALSAGLIRELQPLRASNRDHVSRTPMISDSSGGAAGSAPAGKPGRLIGTWIARPAADTTITLVFQPRRRIVWKVRQQGRDREFAGFAIYQQRTLTISQDQDNSLVGTVHWQDEDHVTFKVLASRPGDPGLSFARSP
jgi:tetratricopeptide (TPR) repeat protein